MKFSTGEMPPEFDEEPIPEDRDLEIILEIEFGQEPAEVIIEKVPEYGPQDDYFEKQQEQERREQLAKMFPRRIP